MAGLRAFDDAADFGPIAGEPGIEAPPVIADQERRFQRRAHDDWLSALRGRSWPCPEDLAPGSFDVPHMILLDIDDPADPAVARIGFALRARAGGDPRRVGHIGDADLASRLTAHYRHVLATGEPLAFEGAEESEGRTLVRYRGLLLPLSCDGRRVDMIYGLLSWREQLDRRAASAIARAAGRAAPAPAPVAAEQIWGA